MKVFISHITEEGPLARELKEWIESTFGGMCDVFVSSNRADLPAGSRWLEVIEAALQDTQVLVVICSSLSIHRPWINFEAGCGWIKGVPILPVCHSGQSKGNLPPPLSLFQALDITDSTFTSDLITALAHHLGFNKIPRIDHAAMLGAVRDAVRSGGGSSRSETVEGAEATVGDGLQRALTGLTAKECRIFARFVDQDSKVASFQIWSHDSESAMTAQMLANKGYLYLISHERSLWYEEFVYVMQDPVFAFLTAHPEVLEPGRKLVKQDPPSSGEDSAATDG